MRCAFRLLCCLLIWACAGASLLYAREQPPPPPDDSIRSFADVGYELSGGGNNVLTILPIIGMFGQAGLMFDVVPERFGIDLLLDVCLGLGMGSGDKYGLCINTGAQLDFRFLDVLCLGVGAGMDKQMLCKKIINFNTLYVRAALSLLLWKHCSCNEAFRLTVFYDMLSPVEGTVTDSGTGETTTLITKLGSKFGVRISYNWVF